MQSFLDLYAIYRVPVLGILLAGACLYFFFIKRRGQEPEDLDSLDVQEELALSNPSEAKEAEVLEEWSRIYPKSQTNAIRCRITANIP